MTTAPSTADLVLLGLLMDSPLHGYELRRLVEERMSQVARIAPGTIYYTLKKLAKRGLIVPSTEREGNRPERHVYEITNAGRDVFHTLLREAVFADERPYYAFDAALYFYPHLDPELLPSAVDAKLARIAEFKQRIEALEGAYPGPWPFHFLALKEKAQLLTAAMDEWYLSLKSGLEKRANRTTTPRTTTRRTKASKTKASKTKASKTKASKTKASKTKSSPGAARRKEDRS